jgi:sugar (pentulose or hexulose) kinase
MSPRAGDATVAVLDLGKSNLKLSACTTAGAVVETLSLPTPSRPGPPWVHFDVGAMAEWLGAGLASLCRRHPLRDLVPVGHGSACALVGAEPEAPVLPVIDYDQPLPEGLAAAYAPMAGAFRDRGSALMMGATHVARQMVWAETAEPEGFARARAVLGWPQYWGWWLTGVAAAEVSYLGAQTHLWRVAEGVWSPLVAARGWGRLMPPVRAAGEVLGLLRAGVRARWGLPEIRVRVGAHDSSLSFHRYQAAGLRRIAVLSTGPWIVGLADGVRVEALEEARGMTLNADLAGRPLGGALCMGGRDYAAIAGDQPAGARADGAALARLVARGTMALPAFGPDDGLFPGRAGKGCVVGPALEGAAERHALAVLQVALLTWTCGDVLAPGQDWVLDGSFLREPLFAPLVAALRGKGRVLVNDEPYGIAAGAALLCHEGAVPPLALEEAAPVDVPGLAGYAALWRARAEGRA